MSNIPRRDNDPGWLGSVATGHEDDCRYRIATECAIPIECDHGYDVCPECNPCTCEEERNKHANID